MALRFKLEKLNFTAAVNLSQWFVLFTGKSNLHRTYVLITFLYSYVKTPYLAQQAFTCSKATIEALEKDLTYVQS